MSTININSKDTMGKGKKITSSGGGGRRENGRDGGNNGGRSDGGEEENTWCAPVLSKIKMQLIHNIHKIL